MRRSEPDPSKFSRFILLASVCVIIAGLYVAREVLVPVVLAMLLSFLLAPLANRLERLGTPRAASVVVVVALALGLVGTIGYVVYNQALDLADDLPQYKDNILAKIERFHAPGTGVFKRVKETVEDVSKHIDAATTQSTDAASQPAVGVVPRSPARAAYPAPGSPENPSHVVVVDPPQGPLEQLEAAVRVLRRPLGMAAVVIVITIFMLLAREDLRGRGIRLLGRGQITNTTQALDDAATRISRYLVMQSLINGIFGTVVALGLWLIGVPNPLLFGLLCGALRFIPYVGPWLGASMPLLIALARFPGHHEFFETLGLFVVLELVTNNVLEPWLYGTSTGLSSFAIIVSAVFWAWLWGPIGLLLSTPLTVVLVVIGKYVPQLQFLEILLGDAPVLAPAEQLYERLLAMDSEESIDLVHEFRKQMTLEKVYDEVMLPALAQSEQDRHRGALDERRKLFIRQTIREIIEELGDSEQADRVVDRAKGKVESDNGKATPNTPPTANVAVAPEPVRSQIPKDCRVSVVSLPARDEADEIGGLMLVQLLNLRGYCAAAVSETHLASEMLSEIEKHHADVVIISALPPAAVAHARYLCKRVEAQYPNLKMVVGLWTFSGNIEKAKQRITSVTSVQLFTTMAQMQDLIDQLMQQKLGTDAGAGESLEEQAGKSHGR